MGEHKNHEITFKDLSVLNVDQVLVPKIKRRILKEWRLKKTATGLVKKITISNKNI